MITANSPIVGTGGTIKEALAFLGRPDAEDVAYVNELFRLCDNRPLDFRVAFAQFCVETADGTSARWRTNRNPAGLGVEQPGDPDPATFTGIEAARVHAFALYHATNRGDALNPLVPASALGFLQRWAAKFRDPNCPLVKTVADLCRHYTDAHGEQQATWAWDETYADQIVRKANTIFKETTMSISYGKVPPPNYVKLICPKIGPGHGYTALDSPRKPVGVCEHITDGHGSIEFYNSFFSIGGEREADALVDFIVGRDGRIAMLNDPWGMRSPWANGNLQGLEGDGPAFLQKFGVAGVNDRLISIEHEGFADEDWTGAQWNASVNLVAWLIDQMHVSHESFPVNQNFGVVTHLFHSEFTDKGGNALLECPGRYIKQHVSEYQAAIKARMMAFQVAGGPTPDPVFKPADLPPWWAKSVTQESPSDADYKGDRWYVVRRKVTAVGDTVRHSRPDVQSDPSGPIVKKGDKLKVERTFLDANDRQWLVEATGHYLAASKFTPQIKIKPRKDT